MKSESVLGVLVRVDVVQKNYVKRAPDKLREGLKLVDGKLHFIPPYIDLTEKKKGSKVKLDGKNLSDEIWNSFQVTPKSPMPVRVVKKNGTVHYSHWSGEFFSVTCTTPDRVCKDGNHTLKSPGINCENSSYIGWLPL